MIHSIFFINNSGDIFLEKHYKRVIPKSICDYFFEEVTKNSSPENVPPIIQTPNHILISIYRAQMHFVAVCKSEVPPLFVIEFLHRLADIIKDYFDEVSETSIKDNVVIVYELLDEVLDNGFPLATESNILKELIRPPNLLRSLADTMTGRNSTVSATLPTGQLSNIPWRRSGVKYANNEAYFDIVEELDAIVDKFGGAVCAEVHGSIDCLIKLSGVPDLTLSFVNSRLIEDASLHPCVRHRRFEVERLLSFVPPDGGFRLMAYRASCHGNLPVPLDLRHTISFKQANLLLQKHFHICRENLSNCSHHGPNCFPGGNSGHLELTVIPRPPSGRQLEDLVLTVPMPRAVSGASLVASAGKYSYDTASRTLVWTVGRLDSQKGAGSPTLCGTVCIGACQV
uniref:MHD domain-containing protein n=1 Tax=Macrostomum lignano TaxID=282301 RepID=A0A1I8GNP5_9PLAT